MNDETKALNVYMSAHLLKAFKIKCIQEGKSIKSVIIDFVKDYAEEEDVREDKTDRTEDEVKKEE